MSWVSRKSQSALPLVSDPPSWVSGKRLCAQLPIVTIMGFPWLLIDWDHPPLLRWYCFHGSFWFIVYQMTVRNFLKVFYFFFRNKNEFSFIILGSWLTRGFWSLTIGLLICNSLSRCDRWPCDCFKGFSLEFFLLPGRIVWLPSWLGYWVGCLFSSLLSCRYVNPQTVHSLL